MTSPVRSTGSWTIPVGGAQQRIDDGAQSPPAGLQLVNRGDNGGTVWIAAGPAGAAAAVPLGPGASLQWTDPAAYPYAYLSSAATAPETVVVSGQSSGYNNPSVVAAALINQGIPSTMVDTDYGTWNITALQYNGTGGVLTPRPTINVGASSSLYIGAQWPQPTPQGYNVLRLAFSDPASQNMPSVYVYLSVATVVEASYAVWQVPVLAPSVQLWNLQAPDNANANAQVSVAGTNRSVPGVRQVNDQGAAGIHQLGATNSVTGGTEYDLNPSAGNGAGAIAVSGSRFTKLNGDCQLSYWLGSGTGYLYAHWIEHNGRLAVTAFRLSAAVGQIPWFHPSVPVWWSWRPDTSVAGNGMSLTVSGAP